MRASFRESTTLPRAIPEAGSGTRPQHPSGTSQMRTAVDLDGHVREGRNGGQALAVAIGRQRLLRDDGDDAGIAGAADAPDMEVCYLGVAVAFDRQSHLRGDGGIHLAIEEHA